ncbi:MAG TPA: efflux transporter outer membrane subunit [Gemmataceae bacterium]|nr:efflux transporter outer membrane subunit [Gemmataceae bacterium]
MAARAAGLLRPLLKVRPSRWVLGGTLALSLCGCTTLDDYVHNGFKVGPNYKRPPAPVAEHWIDAADVRVRSEEADDSHWWTVFNDPALNDLVQTAYRQNLTLREAGFRVLEARTQVGIAVGEFFPQTQNMTGDVQSHGVSTNVANRVATPQRWYGQWDYGFALSWELDFWGRFRRAIEAADDTLDASVENYDDVLVTLVGDVAATYVQVRTLQQQIAYARQTLELQRQSLEIATAKFKGGQTSNVDVNQGQSDVSTTEALIEQLQIPLRQATNRLCVLLGLPPEDILRKLGEVPIPTAPPEVIVGVPADLLRRRPDVRRAERLAAAQCAEIGVADADFYPQISIDATFGWSAQELKDLFAHGSFREIVGPSFRWPILNYGRILNNVRLQDARFQALVVSYQNTVLKAGEEVEDGLVTFLRAQKRTRDANEAVNAEMAALKEAIAQYKGGLVDFNRVVLIQERLVERQQTLAEAQGQIALGLIQVYKALGGGWQIRCGEGTADAPVVVAVPGPAPIPVKSAPQSGAATGKPTHGSSEAAEKAYLSSGE